MYGGVRGRKTRVGEKLHRFPPTRFVQYAIILFYAITYSRLGVQYFFLGIYILVDTFFCLGVPMRKRILLPQTKCIPALTEVAFNKLLYEILRFILSR